MPSMHARRDTMKASFNTTTTYIIVAFVMMTFIFFGVNSFLGITYSADVVAKDLEMLDTIDVAHMFKTCLEGSDSRITLDEVGDFSPSSCEDMFPGLDEVDYDFRISNLETNQVLKESSGYEEESTRYRHSIAINIDIDGDIQLGRLYVQRE